MTCKAQIAGQFLRKYDVHQPELGLIRHNENLVYHVTDGKTGDFFVLRIHRPAEGLSPDTPQHSPEALTAELTFLQAIAEHTDIGVQRPVRTVDGDLVGRLTGPGEEGTLHATMLTWVAGSPMRRNGPEWEREAYQTGIMAAKLHDFSADWSPGSRLVRHRYDRAMLEDKARVIASGVELGLFTRAQYHTIERGTERIVELMAELGRRPRSWGLIHSDLQSSNLIVHNDTVTPIDFALSGYGFFLQDLGGLSADFRPLHIRQALLSGYRTVRALPEADTRYVEAFLVAGILLFMATHLHNPKVHEWFGRRMATVCREYIEPLIRDERFSERDLG